MHFTKSCQNYKSAEHYYQAQKFINNPILFDQIKNTSSAREAFNIAQKNKVLVRKNWPFISLLVMFQAVYHKFNNDEYLKKILLNTDKKYLIEDSPLDNFYGAFKDGSGQNYLGRILMYVRSLLSNNSTLPRFEHDSSLIKALEPYEKNLRFIYQDKKQYLHDNNYIFFYDKNKPYYEFTNFYEKKLCIPDFTKYESSKSAELVEIIQQPLTIIQQKKQRFSRNRKIVLALILGIAGLALYAKAKKD